MTEHEGPDQTPALRAIVERGTRHRVVRTGLANSAEESASMQGIPLGALLRTIVVRRGEDDYLFVLVPAGRRFDWPKLRAHLGVTRLSLPDADEAQRATGYVRYTITPFGSTAGVAGARRRGGSWSSRSSRSAVARGASTSTSRPSDLVAALAATVVDVSIPDPA